MKPKYFHLISKVPSLSILFLPVSQHALCPSHTVFCHPSHFLMLMPRPVAVFLLLSQLDCLLSPLHSGKQSFSKASLNSHHFCETPSSCSGPHWSCHLSKPPWYSGSRFSWSTCIKKFLAQGPCSQVPRGMHTHVQSWDARSCSTPHWHCTSCVRAGSVGTKGQCSSWPDNATVTVSRWKGCICITDSLCYKADANTLL